jgi:predicted dehydrogenase
MAKVINIGMVGTKFMGKAHSNAWRQVGRFFDVPAKPVMKVICGRDPKSTREAAALYGWEEWITSWKELIKRPDIHLVDVCTDNSTHAEIAIAAAKARKHVLCEKPLAMNLAQAKQMLKAVKDAGVTHMVCQNYRALPAVALAKQLMDKKALGEIFHWRAVYLQDWIVDPNFPLVWRLQKKYAASGAHGDLNEHLIDMARFLVGDITHVAGLMKTFVKERPLPAEIGTALAGKAGRGKGKVDVDDATMFLAKFENGVVGAFEATRFAPGHKNYNCFEINGSKGSIIFNLERMNELQYFDRGDPGNVQGFRTIQATDASHPYAGAWWPPGHIIGYEHSFIHTFYNLLTAVARKKPASPSFEDGVKSQAVLEAVAVSAKSGKWEKVPA